MFLWFAIFSAFQSALCANILGIFVVPSISHQVVYQPLWRELSLRGHKVTVVTPNPLKDSNLVNLTEIDVHYTYELMEKLKIKDLLSIELNKMQYIANLYWFLHQMAEIELENTEFKRLIANEEQTFDLIITEWIYPATYALSARYDAPSIAMSSLGATTVTHDAVGNPSHPILYPDLVLNYNDDKLSLWQKVNSVVFSVWYRIYYNWVVLPRADLLAKKHFGENIPSVGILERNMSLLFLNTNPLIYSVRPNVPAVIDVSQIHIQPVKPLPEDLKAILDNATEGVIYFSLGSNIKSVDLPAKFCENVINAFSELPYKILLKWEANDFPGKLDNVVIRKWLPQQDVLAHPNIRAFVTQGGLQSLDEAIFRGVPLIGIPFLAEQLFNMYKVVKHGIGLSINSNTLTKDELKTAIIDVAENKRYKKRVEEMRHLLLDQPMTGLEKAIWWTEYVIRHRGAKHLRSPALDVSWYHYYLLDVLVVIFVLPLLTTICVYKLVGGAR